jgi:hypothetical protein
MSAHRSTVAPPAFLKPILPASWRADQNTILLVGLPGDLDVHANALPPRATTAPKLLLLMKMPGGWMGARKWPGPPSRDPGQATYPKCAAEGRLGLH